MLEHDITDIFTQHGYTHTGRRHTTINGEPIHQDHYTHHNGHTAVTHHTGTRLIITHTNPNGTITATEIKEPTNPAPAIHEFITTQNRP